MKGTQLNACLVLLLVALSVNYSYEAVYGGTCAEDEECDSIDEAFCHKYDQCTIGVCACKYGYSRADEKCKELIKIGDSCDNATETCYAGNCTDGECTCSTGLPSDNDKKCGREYDEDCDQSSDCLGDNMSCTGGECGCKSNYKEYEYTTEFGETYTTCVPSTANIEVEENKACDNTATFCDSDLMCRSCPGSSTLKCMSGVGRLSVGLYTLAFGSLLMAAILALLF